VGVVFPITAVIFSSSNQRGTEGERCTFTDEQDVVVAEAHRTFTAEAPDLIDAHSAGTDTRYLPALVNICTEQQQRVLLCKLFYVTAA